MSSLQNIFEESVKNYKGNKAELLSVDNFTLKLKEELPKYFLDWMNPDVTGEDSMEPISKIEIEIDSGGETYSVLFDEDEDCIVDEGTGPNLFDWGIVSTDEGDYEFEKRQGLVAQFLALCFEKALPEACKSKEFLSLPRAEKITFTVGAHAGWQAENFYTYEGDRHEVDFGNPNALLRELKSKGDFITESVTIENQFMKHLNNIDVQKCANELILVFEKAIQWMSEQNPKPIEYIIIVWSSNFDKEAIFGANGEEDEMYRWPDSFDFSNWFSNSRPENLDNESLKSVREALSYKLAEIACLASEHITELEVFKSLPKTDGFQMEMMNRTTQETEVFYPFDYDKFNF